MKAIVCHSFGDPTQLQLEEVSLPDPKIGEVQIAVRACGINFADTLMIQGMYQVQPPFPFSPGLEVAGEVVAVGTDVAGLQVGDRVLAVVNYGGYAERVNAPAALTVKIPAAMDFPTAAAFPINYGTSHIALVDRAQLQAGETLLVGGAAGGVGLTAVELGKLLGATVIAAASSPEKLALAQQYGADHLLNYQSEDIRKQIKNLTQGSGVDVVYDPVGGDFFESALKSINWGARLLVIGFASGHIPDMQVNRLLIKNAAVLGVFWGAYALHHPQVMLESLHTLLEWYTQGRLKPHISRQFPLAEVSQALQFLLSRESTGKVVLIP
jgi:NADPH2:quinone reductase